MAALGGCTKIGALEVGKCGDMQGGEEFRVVVRKEWKESWGMGGLTQS